MQEYRILTAKSYGDLVKQVNQAFITGWTAQGGVAVDKETFYQAIVKPKE